MIAKAKKPQRYGPGHTFDFDQALIIDKVLEAPGGMREIHTSFHGVFRIQRRMIRMETTSKLRGRGLIVGHFNRERRPISLIIAAGSKERLPRL